MLFALDHCSLIVYFVFNVALSLSLWICRPVRWSSGVCYVLSDGSTQLAQSSTQNTQGSTQFAQGSGSYGQTSSPNMLTLADCWAPSRMLNNMYVCVCVLFIPYYIHVHVVCYYRIATCTQYYYYTTFSHMRTYMCTLPPSPSPSLSISVSVSLSLSLSLSLSFLSPPPPPPPPHSCRSPVSYSTGSTNLSPASSTAHLSVLSILSDSDSSVSTHTCTCMYMYMYLSTCTTFWLKLTEWLSCIQLSSDKKATLCRDQ